MIEIGPSVLSADFAHLGSALALIEEGGADAVHVDVMDGHFVPNLTLGPPVIRNLSKVTRLPLDCHLMITGAERDYQAYVDAGAARVTVHWEACTHLHRLLTALREAGVETGVAVNPATPVALLEEILDLADQILVMSVNPGFSGQHFIPASLEKVRRLTTMRKARGAKFEIQVDGGVSTANIAALAEAGARRFVAGNAVFGAPDPGKAIAALRSAGEAGL